MPWVKNDELVRKDEERDRRIEMEIIVDSYTEDEQMMGWYYYLEDSLDFPFKAKCIRNKAKSPLRQGEVIKVFNLATEDECGDEMYVETVWSDRTIAVPLSQLKPLEANEKTMEAIGDWHYWAGGSY